MPIDLNKFEKEFENKDAQLVDLTKKTAVSLKKHNLNGNIAKVAVCLDISYSMQRLYRNGDVSELVKKLIPLGLSFDDDGEIDIFTFGVKGAQQDSINLSNYESRLDTMRNQGLEGGTNYAKAIKLVESYYAQESDAHDVPVYVVFITDGDANDKTLAAKAMKSVSNLPIFFQFVAIGADYRPNEEVTPPPTEKKGFFGKLFGGSSEAPRNQPPTLFKFLVELDNMTGRKVDNAGFFAVKSPSSATPDELYDLLMSEYPDFLKAAKAARILR